MGKGKIGTSMVTHRIEKPKSKWYSEKEINTIQVKSKKNKRLNKQKSKELLKRLKSEYKS